jgi:hypothetical protein
MSRMKTFVTGDHFDVDFFRKRGCTYVFYDDVDQPWYEFDVADDLIGVWRAAKEQYTGTLFEEFAGASEAMIYQALHRPIRRPDE